MACLHGIAERRRHRLPEAHLDLCPKNSGFEGSKSGSLTFDPQRWDVQDFVEPKRHKKIGRKCLLRLSGVKTCFIRIIFGRGGCSLGAYSTGDDSAIFTAYSRHSRSMYMCISKTTRMLFRAFWVLYFLSSLLSLKTYCYVHRSPVPTAGSCKCAPVFYNGLPNMHVSSFITPWLFQPMLFNHDSVPFGGQGVDDTIALKGMLPKCSTNSTIIFNKYTTYNISWVHCPIMHRDGLPTSDIFLCLGLSARPWTLESCSM